VEVSVPGGGKYVLVGYLTSPLPLGTLQEYVLFAIGAPADEYRWTLTPPPGVPPATITTQIGSLSNWYDELGAHELQVEVMDSGATVATLVLTQEVEPPDPALETRLGSYKSQFTDVEREIGNDLAAYIRQGATATGPNGIPTHLLSTILFQEGLARAAKRGSFKAVQAAKSGDREGIREDQADILAEEFESGKSKPTVYPDGAIGPMGPSLAPKPRTLGPGSVGLWNVAGIVSPPLIPWLEADLDAVLPWNYRSVLIYRTVLAFRELPYLTQVDIFNLARFPKSSIALSARLLAKLKNRPHRWPATATADVLADPHLLEIIGSEYCNGPTTTPAASARPSHYGDSTRQLATGSSAAFDLDLLP
jgi:hypothetical protein